VHPGRVHEHDLALDRPLPCARIRGGQFGLAVPNPQDARAGSLRLGRDDGQLLTDDSVEQGGLAHVGPAQDGHGSGHAKGAKDGGLG